MREISDVPPVTFVTRPARPPAAITGWFTRTPSPEPLSIFTLEYQTVGERAITRADTGLVPCGNPSARPSFTSPRSCWLSRRAVSFSPRRLRSSSFSAFRSSFSPLASSVSPNQPARSRAGLSARLAPVSIGANASWAPFWSVWKKPPPDSPK